MKKTTFIYTLFCVWNIVAVGCSTHTESEVPAIYRQGILELKDQMEKLNRIPLEDKGSVFVVEHNAHTGVIDYGKRAEYIKKNIPVWDETFAHLDKAIRTIELKHWKDDALFIKALGYLTVASLEYSDMYTDNALSSMTDYIEFDEYSEIEPWTKRQLKTVFWDKMAPLFSKNVSERENINAFFHIGIASLLEHKKRDMQSALSEYEKALRIDAQGFFAEQSRAQIELLKAKLDAEKDPGKKGTSINP